MNIDFANLQIQYQKYKIDIDKKIQSILDKSNYILGQEIQELEQKLEKFSGAKHAISCSSGTDYFTDIKSFNSFIGGISYDKSTISDGSSATKEIHGFSTSSTPYNVMYNVQKKLPLFTKSKKSKSLYAAGYYIIHFDKGWVRSFCPKLVTLEKYESKGPFKTEFTMRQELSDANKRTN